MNTQGNRMNLTEIKNDQGNLSGIMIPASDFSEIKESLKKGSRLYHYLDQLMSVKENKNDDIVLSSGYTIGETNRAGALLAEDIYRQAFKKGIPIYYQDERTKAADEFIAANPDGSEDLVKYDLEDRKHSLIKNLTPPGKSQFAYLSPSRSLTDETTVLYSGGAKRGR